MIPSGFLIDFEQVGAFQYLIKVTTPDNNKFIGGIQAPGLLMNKEIAAQIWSEKKSEFFLELETKCDIVKV